MKSFVNRLSEARKNAHLTLEQVAEQLQVTAQTVGAWESGTEALEYERIPELARRYGVTSDWLLTGKAPSAEILEITSNLSDRLFNEDRMFTYIGAYSMAKKLYQTKRMLSYAKSMHSGQYRKKGHSSERIPYIYHPLLLTCHALALGLDEDNLLSACLLHDVCEDCGVAPEELPVNEETREAIRLLTKTDSYYESEENQQAYYDAIAKNRIATLVKLLDRCNNISSMATSFSDQKMADYMMETKLHILPLMEHARFAYPEYSNQLFLIRYHMNSVMEALRHHMRSIL